MSIIDRIDLRLKALELSGREACERAGLGESYIRDLRRNSKQSPRVEELEKLAKALETSVTWLITGAGDPKQKPDPDSAQVISFLSGLDAKRKGELAAFAKFLAEQKKRETK